MSALQQTIADSTISVRPHDNVIRVADHEIEPFFLQRWSSRAFSDDEISDPELFRLFEAARWAPSGGNNQPWRFIYAKRDTAHWPVFVQLLNERNRIWASKAAALIFVVSRSFNERNGKRTPSPNSSFDAGAAWYSLALQAFILGWNTRAMGGIDRDGVKAALRIPDDYQVNVAIAIGRRGAKDSLPEDFHAGETPNARRPLNELISEGSFQGH